MEELNMNKELKHSVKKVILHPKYIRKKRDMNDLALIKVKGTIVFNKASMTLNALLYIVYISIVLIKKPIGNEFLWGIGIGKIIA